MQAPTASTWIALLVMLSGCANQTSSSLTRGEKAGLGAVTGAALGGLVGGLTGGGQWAAIGAASGGLIGGVATYALAADPVTQTMASQTRAWEEKKAAKTVVVHASPVAESGQQKQQLDTIRSSIPDQEMVSGAHLQAEAKGLLQDTATGINRVGGTAVVLCPENTPGTVREEIEATGIKTSPDATLKGHYVLVLTRSRATQSNALTSAAMASAPAVDALAHCALLAAESARSVGGPSRRGLTPT